MNTSTHNPWAKQTVQKLNQLFFWPKPETLPAKFAEKTEMGARLANWMAKALEQHQAVVAVVARPGSPKNAKYDATGMFHSGLVFYHPEKQEWQIHNLINGGHLPENRHEILEVSPQDFFSQQGGKQGNALVLIPDKSTQKQLLNLILNTDARHLRFTPLYNLVSPPSGSGSLNCNKWVLLNLLAAKYQSTQPDRLLKHIDQHYHPSKIEVHPIIRLFAKQRPNIIQHEIPWLSPIYTVTVESLYKSELFEKRLFYQTPPGLS